jgi:cation diffusion facilitator CzcD-associated flavoprotein CzcO
VERHADALVDLDEVRLQYRQERDKRLRPDGTSQYIEVTAEFSEYVEDPWAEAEPPRAPLSDEVEFALVGAGFTNILTAARLKEAGFTGLRFIDRAGDFGGTWYWNRYPGARCDVESLIYLPLLEETKYVPRERYASSGEIREYAQMLARRFDLYSDTCFQTGVTGMAWDESARRWLISTDKGDLMRARFVIVANGALDKPKLPGIPGINEFQGYKFHTSRWDYRFTGGTEYAPMTKLLDKRVGIIGTGATAIQCIPPLAESSGHLYVFQRTPAAVDVRDNSPIDADWLKSLQPGWQKERQDNFSDLTSGGDREVDLVADAWTDIFRNLTGIAAAVASRRLGRRLAADEKRELLERADFFKMEEIRARVDRIVRDKETAEALKPWYRRFCKRPIFHDGYLETFNRTNVTLVDTNGKGVDRLTPNSVVVGDTEYQVDCLIFASGFDSGGTTNFTKRLGFDILGRNGRSLGDEWSDGYRTLHGMHSHGFPNCFFLGVTQNGSSVNYMHSAIEQAEHLVYILKEMRCRRAAFVETTREAQEEWVAEIKRLATIGQEFYEECTPGTNNNEGRPDGRMTLAMVYGRGPIKFFELMSDWRARSDLKGLSLTP